MMLANFVLRRGVGPAHLRRLQRARQEDAELEEVLLRPDEEVARLARKHDRVVRRVDALLAEVGRRLAQPLPRVPEILRQILGQHRLGRRPAVVRFVFFDPLLAVVTLVAGHGLLYAP